MIEYRFIFNDSAPIRFQIHLDRTRVAPETTGPHADWTRLCTHQCQICPLKPATHSNCPVAVDLEPIIEQFRRILSFEMVRVEVDTPQRSYSKTCDVQTGLRSLIGLVMASSECPWLGQLRALADTHLPFATVEETLMRSAGAYLLQQYLDQEEGKPAPLNLGELDALYKGLWQVNQAFKRRLEMASMNDANLNAIGALSIISQGISFSLQEHLSELRTHFVSHPIRIPSDAPRVEDTASPPDF